jgi:hypothetical protein
VGRCLVNKKMVRAAERLMPSGDPGWPECNDPTYTRPQPMHAHESVISEVKAEEKASSPECTDPYLIT